MTRRLRDEIKQTRPFTTIEEEVCLEIQRTAQVVVRWVVDALKPSGLTPPQFNVLRILRGANPEALSSSMICERMVTYDPDLTRLLDRLESAGFVLKSRDTRDRRVVNVHITKAGLEVVERASEAVRAKLQETMSGLGARRLEELADQLEALRGNTS